MKTNQIPTLTDDDRNKPDWNTETEIKCKHCKRKLSKFEAQVCKTEWNVKHHHHWCCYVCYQEYHL